MSELKVKQLEWLRGVVDAATPLPGMRYVACSSLREKTWSWWLEHAPETRSVCDTEADAKAAAQADFEKRILSAIEPDENQSKHFENADKFWCTWDVSNNGPTPEEAIKKTEMDNLIVHEVASSFEGPTRYCFIAPVLGSNKGETELLHFPTFSEAMEAANERYKALNSQGEEE